MKCFLVLALFVVTLDARELRADRIFPSMRPCITHRVKGLFGLNRKIATGARPAPEDISTLSPEERLFIELMNKEGTVLSYVRTNPLSNEGKQILLLSHEHIKNLPDGTVLTRADGTSVVKDAKLLAIVEIEGSSPFHTTWFGLTYKAPKRSQAMSYQLFESLKGQKGTRLTPIGWSKDEHIQENILLLSEKHLESLPDGTVVWSQAGHRKIKGLDYLDLDTRGGMTYYGLRAGNSEEDIAWVANRVHSHWQNTTTHTTRFKSVKLKNGKIIPGVDREKYLAENKIPPEFHKYFKVNDKGELVEDIKFIPNSFLSHGNNAENINGAIAALDAKPRVVKDLEDAERFIEELCEDVHIAWKERNTWAKDDPKYEPPWKMLSGDMQEQDFNPLKIAIERKYNNPSLPQHRLLKQALDNVHSQVLKKKSAK